MVGRFFILCGITDTWQVAEVQKDMLGCQVQVCLKSSDFVQSGHDNKRLSHGLGCKLGAFHNLLGTNAFPKCTQCLRLQRPAQNSKCMAREFDSTRL